MFKEKKYFLKINKKVLQKTTKNLKEFTKALLGSLFIEKNTSKGFEKKSGSSQWTVPLKDLMTVH